MTLTRHICLTVFLLFCTSMVVEAGPRGRRGFRRHNRGSRFPVIIDYQGGAGWNDWTGNQWMPSGSATYTTYPPGWRGPVWSSVPPAVYDPTTIPPQPPMIVPGYEYEYSPGVRSVPAPQRRRSLDRGLPAYRNEAPRAAIPQTPEFPQSDGRYTSPGAESETSTDETELKGL